MLINHFNNIDFLPTIRFAFRVYDVDGDGLIGLEELFQVCSNVYGSLTEKELKLAQRRTSVKVLAKSPSKLMTEKPSFSPCPYKLKALH